MSDPTNSKDLVGVTKAPLNLLPAAARIHAAMAMKDGAGKYGAYNWRGKKVRAMIYLDALERHLLSFLDGEDYADDSGVHHLGHVIACAAILLDAKETGNLVDDRPAKGAASRILAEMARIVKDQKKRPDEDTAADVDPRQPGPKPGGDSQAQLDAYRKLAAKLQAKGDQSAIDVVWGCNHQAYSRFSDSDGRTRCAGCGATVTRVDVLA